MKKKRSDIRGAELLVLLATLIVFSISGCALTGPTQGEGIDSGMLEIRDDEPPALKFPENGVTRGFYETPDGRWKFTGDEGSLPSATEYFDWTRFLRVYYKTKAL